MNWHHSASKLISGDFVGSSIENLASRQSWSCAMYLHTEHHNASVKCVLLFFILSKAGMKEVFRVSETLQDCTKSQVWTTDANFGCFTFSSLSEPHKLKQNNHARRANWPVHVVMDRPILSFFFCGLSCLLTTPHPPTKLGLQQPGHYCAEFISIRW